MNLRKYGTEVPFEDILENWDTDARPGHFLNEPRETKNQVYPDVSPLIHDRHSFDMWKAAMLSNAQQTWREAERHQELIACAPTSAAKAHENADQIQKPSLTSRGYV